MEGRKEGFRRAANDNFRELPPKRAQGIELPDVETGTRMGIWKTAARIRETGEKPYLWSEAKRHETAARARALSLSEAIRTVNESTEKDWQASPTYFLALLEHIETIQNRAGQDVS